MYKPNMKEDYEIVLEALEEERQDIIDHGESQGFWDNLGEINQKINLVTRRVKEYESTINNT